MGEEGDYKTNATLQRFKRRLLGQDKTSSHSCFRFYFLFLYFFIATLSRFINCEGQSHKIKSTNKVFFLKRKESRSGIEPRASCLPA